MSGFSKPNPVHQGLMEALKAGFGIRRSSYRWAWAESNSNYNKTYLRTWYALHKNTISAQRKLDYEEDREGILSKNRERYALHSADINAKIRLRRKSDPQFKISLNLRRRLKHAIKNNQKTGSAVRDLGCSVEYLKAFLEGQFEPGMSWDTYGKWEIDHIRPLASFDLTDPEQFKQAVHYSNLQPLWMKDNRSKGDKKV